MHSPSTQLVFDEIACSFYTVSVHRLFFFPTAEQLWWNENANWMQQISGQQWLLAVLSLQLTPQLAWCGPTQRVQPHDCARLLVFRASTTNSQFISLLSFPSHRSPSMFDNFFFLNYTVFSALLYFRSTFLILSHPGPCLNPLWRWGHEFISVLQKSAIAIGCSLI